MIEVKNIEKSFGDSKVLKGISSIFETGKTNLIIGQSGSGKTVLLKSLLGIFTPDLGTISFDGRIYSELEADEKRELRTEIGMVFQGSALFDGMTVEENIGFPLKMFTNKSEEEIRERANVVIDRVNLINANHKNRLKFRVECKNVWQLQEPLLIIRNIFFVMSPIQDWTQKQQL
jgi:phospholipid/cholesterol/gamma-HCH transport system ATP-binding protein